MSKITGFMLLHDDGDLEYYEPKLTAEDIDTIYRILDNYGDNNESIRGDLVVKEI